MTATTRPDARLTRRQTEVLAAYARHGNRREAGDELGISEETVRANLGNAYEALGVHDGISAFRVLGWLVPR